ncbi:hypothetical protein [Streptomyces sp. SID339]|uniref:hypothetical protein n=1 Tax=Streptomyces sp. SID339 TaxID=2706080 RepID=UPI00136EFF0D|nr:hypothetical protein [Streptomyces sp. SID339]MYZ18424.1 hypothetical protein [Streptomyces sp. SID337]NEB45726.1 hypothetical protein [Streptomyces sp. SID339]
MGAAAGGAVVVVRWTGAWGGVLCGVLCGVGVGAGEPVVGAAGAGRRAGVSCGALRDADVSVGVWCGRLFAAGVLAVGAEALAAVRWTGAGRGVFRGADGSARAPAVGTVVAVRWTGFSRGAVLCGAVLCGAGASDVP